jgi:cytoskeletal protein CcmA (bactofilin family)
MKNKETTTELNIIGQGTTVEGNIVTDNALRIHGKVIGDVKCEDTLTIGAEGVIEGNITARNGIISGKIHGNIAIAEKLMLNADSVLRGELSSRRLVIEEGAIFDGQSQMSDSQPDNKKRMPKAGNDGDA